MALSSVIPVVAFATGEIVAAFLMGAVAVGTFIAVGAIPRSRRARRRR
jgi:hypothetical protein